MNKPILILGATSGIDNRAAYRLTGQVSLDNNGVLAMGRPFQAPLFRHCAFIGSQN